jgi:hypothetical protein
MALSNGDGKAHAEPESAEKSTDCTSPSYLAVILTDVSYSPDYFQYYASLQNQANMIQDFSRTQAYRRAILGNAIPAFQDKLVIDIGAGSLAYLRFTRFFEY